MNDKKISKCPAGLLVLKKREAEKNCQTKRLQTGYLTTFSV